MAVKGLDATAYRDWIDKSIVITPQLNNLFSEFVVGAPAYGLSHKGRDLYNYYHFITTTEYDALFLALFSGLDFQSFEKYEDLKNAILADGTMNFSTTLPSLGDEHIFIYIGSVSDSDFFNAYFKTSSSVKGKKKDEIKMEAEQRKKTVAIDKLFYHIRNGLAHGCYTISSKDDNEYIVIQDESKDKCISARMILKVKTVEKWISFFKSREQSINEIME